MCGAMNDSDARRCLSCGEQFGQKAKFEDNPIRGMLIAVICCYAVIVGIGGLLKLATPLLSSMPWWQLAVTPAIGLGLTFVAVAAIILIARQLRR